VQALDRSNLSDQQRQAVVEFSRRLNKRYAVAEVVLYGSYARGQGTPGSDIDLLVVLDEPVNRSLREAIYDMAFDLNLEHDTLISVLVVDRDSWNHGPLSVSGIHMAVQEDGIRI
jgi:predicted nucleotidyltransferase